jgi:hypothetical protein
MEDFFTKKSFFRFIFSFVFFLKFLSDGVSCHHLVVFEVNVPTVGDLRRVFSTPTGLAKNTPSSGEDLVPNMETADTETVLPAPVETPEPVVAQALSPTPSPAPEPVVQKSPVPEQKSPAVVQKSPVAEAPSPSPQPVLVGRQQSPQLVEKIAPLPLPAQHQANAHSPSEKLIVEQLNQQGVGEKESVAPCQQSADAECQNLECKKNSLKLKKHAKKTQIE